MRTLSASGGVHASRCAETWHRGVYYLTDGGSFLSSCPSCLPSSGHELDYYFEIQKNKVFAFDLREVEHVSGEIYRSYSD